ncbi:hypothetical protein PQZ41_03030, partial [Planktomarina temperata]|nr:hypothetical protein [Planktomarina temperata]
DDEEMFSKLAASRILICPSYYESYSIVCQDAILLNLGVLASPHVHGKQHFFAYNYFKVFPKMNVDSLITELKSLEIVMQSEVADSKSFLNEASKFSGKFGVSIA